MLKNEYDACVLCRADEKAVLLDEITGLPLDESSTTAKTSLDEKRQFKGRLQTYLWLLAVLIPQDTSYIAQ